MNQNLIVYLLHNAVFKIVQTLNMSDHEHHKHDINYLSQYYVFDAGWQIRVYNLHSTTGIYHRLCRTFHHCNGVIGIAIHLLAIIYITGSNHCPNSYFDLNCEVS